MAYSEIDGRRNAGCYFFENVGPRAHNYSYLISTCVSAFTLGLCLINITTPKSSKKKAIFFLSSSFCYLHFKEWEETAMFTECSCVLKAFLLIFPTSKLCTSQSNKCINLYKSAAC